VRLPIQDESPDSGTCLLFVGPGQNVSCAVLVCGMSKWSRQAGLRQEALGAQQAVRRTDDGVVNTFVQ
jgi:hypothetical protein